MTEADELQLARGRVGAGQVNWFLHAKAFSGELVETEADLARREARDYEPASVLLERIAAERESIVNEKANARKRRSTDKKIAKTKKIAR